MEKAVALIHYDLSSKGGGERVCVSIIEALNKEGIVPSLYTTDTSYVSTLGKYYGKSISCNPHAIFPYNAKTLGIYKTHFSGFISTRLSKYDVVINTGSYLPISLGFLIKKYFTFIYCPRPHFDIDEKYRANILWKLYAYPVLAFKKRSLSKIGDDVMLAISDFTKIRIKHYWGKASTTVYPPVDVDKFKITSGVMQRDGVISIARFSPEKNHRIQLEIAKNLPELTFRLCGTANTSMFKRVLNESRAHAEELGLKNVEFYPNLPFNKLTELIGESKYFLHTMINEDFGLTPCEAILGGCLPIVHNSGGMREVIPYRELRFNDVDEAVRRFKAVSASDTRNLLLNLQAHVKENFSEEAFQKRIIKILLS